MLAAYAGIALAIGLAYTRDLIYGPSSFEAMQVAAPWDRPNGSFLAASLIALFFAVIGARAVFAMPIALRANWIFRLTAVHSPGGLFPRGAEIAVHRGGRSGVDGGGCGVFCNLAGMGCRRNTWRCCWCCGILLVELSLYRFRKIPVRLLVPARQSQSERPAGHLGNRISFCGRAGRAPGILGDAELSAICRAGRRAACRGLLGAPPHQCIRCVARQPAFVRRTAGGRYPPVGPAARCGVSSARAVSGSAGGNSVRQAALHSGACVRGPARRAPPASHGYRATRGRPSLRRAHPHKIAGIQCRGHCADRRGHRRQHSGVLDGSCDPQQAGARCQRERPGHFRSGVPESAGSTPATTATRISGTTPPRRAQ